MKTRRKKGIDGFCCVLNFAASDGESFRAENMLVRTVNDEIIAFYSESCFFFFIENGLGFFKGVRVMINIDF